MDDTLLLTLALEGAGEGSAQERQAVEAFIAGLVADLNGLEAVRASTVSEEGAEPGSKGLGPLLLGVLTAEVQGELVAVRVVRHLCGRVGEQPHNVRLKIESKGSDGAGVSVELEGTSRDPEALRSLMAEAEGVVRRLR
ncbi:MAG: hypothetical protein ACK587_10830 [Cyanobacteriota bacterium]